MKTSVKALCGVAMMALAAPAAANPAAAMFGARETIEDIDLSPDGKTIVYVSPGPGTTSLVNVAAVDGGTEKAVTRSSGKPDRLS